MRAAAHRQRGAALLVALLTVGLVTTLAATAYWRQWQAWAIERTERERAQAGWLLTGALDWARLIVREDGRASSVDHLGEPWAVPLQPTRLAAFLERTAEEDDTPSAWLSGRIEDAQGRLNWRNLIEVVGERPRIVPAEFARFERLFQQLGLPPQELQRVAEALVQAWSKAAEPGTARPLPPQRLADLRALGLSEPTLAALEPWTVWLPTATPLNVNTAPAVVLQAAIAGLDAATAQRVVEQRAQRHYATPQAFVAALARPDLAVDVTRLDVSSHYFLVTGRVRLDALTVEQRALLARDGTRVNVLWRQQRPVSADRPAAGNG